MEKIFEKSYHVGAGETDLFNRLRPSSLLSFLQDAATLHAEELRISRDTLIESMGGVWIMSRLWYELKRPVAGGEELLVKTWHRGARGVFFYRDFDISMNGEKIGEAVTAWVIVNRESRTIIRPSAIKDIYELSMLKNGRDTKLSRLRTPEQTIEKMRRKICYSDLDINSHLNNTKYMDIICDVIHMEDKSGKFIDRFQINYLAECHAGEEVSVITGESDGGIYVGGLDCSGRARFESVTHLGDDGENNLTA